MEKKQTNFLGMPVSGDITGAHKRVVQRPQAELEPYLRAMLDDPFIAEFGWRQYTPYFNDGEPCEFGVHGAWCKTVEDLEKAADPSAEYVDDYEFDLDNAEHPTLGGVPWRGPAKDLYQGSHQRSWETAQAFRKAIDGGTFDDALLALFGDHAEITVHKDGITVEFYSHD